MKDTDSMMNDTPSGMGLEGGRRPSGDPIPNADISVLLLCILGTVVTYLFYSYTLGFIHSIDINGLKTYTSDLQGGIESDAEAAISLSFIVYPLISILFLVFRNQTFLKRFFLCTFSIINLLFFWGFYLTGFIHIWETIYLDANISLLMWILIAHIILPTYFFYFIL